MVPVAVFGALGKMGSTVCAAVAASEDLELVAAVDPRAEPDARAFGVPVASSIEAVAQAGAAVAIDFTAPASAVANLEWCAAHRVHAVCGTTGIDEQALARLAGLFGGADGPNAIIAPNFSLSAVMMMRLAEIAAPFFDGGEIVELHHDEKVDAPSGTSIETARRIAAARAESGRPPFAGDPTTKATLEGARGAAAAEGIRIHAVRLRGLVAHQEVLFGAEGQTLSIRQDTYDRSSFMPGVLLAIRRVGATPGLTIGLDELLSL